MRQKAFCRDKRGALLVLSLGVLVSAWGCRTKSADSDAEMRKAFSQKTFDINQVPEKDRERVRAIMEAQKAMKK